MKLKLGIADETEYWIDIPKCIKKIYAIYLYNADLGVHCCSLQPSIEAHFVSHYPIYTDEHIMGDFEWDEADEYIRKGALDEEPVAYYNDEFAKHIDVELDYLKDYVDINFEDTEEVRERMDEIIHELMDGNEHERLVEKLL